MRVLILGSGSGIPIIGHFNESVLVEVGGSSYLIDAGEPCAAVMHTRTLLEFYGVSDRFRVETPKIDIYSIRSVFISHSDADHVSGLPMLLQVMHLWQKRGERFRFKPENSLSIYLPEDFIEPFKVFLKAVRLAELRYRLEISQVREGEFYNDERVRVSALRNTHLRDGFSYSFLLEAEGKRLVYSGDLRSISELYPLLDDETDLAIVECAHFEPEELFTALKGKAIRRLIVNHIHDRLYGREEEIERLGNEVLNCEVRVGLDNMEVRI